MCGCQQFLSVCRYDRARCELKYVKDTQLLAAMAPPGGGRNHFSQRISACFSTINMTQPNDAQLRRIFSTLLNMKLSEFDDDVRPLAEPIVAASVEIYRAVSRELLPTPSKSHYLFNTRDLAKVVLGVMQVGTTEDVPLLYAFDLEPLPWLEGCKARSQGLIKCVQGRTCPQKNSV